MSKILVPEGMKFEAEVRISLAEHGFTPLMYDGGENHALELCASSPNATALVLSHFCFSVAGLVKLCTVYHPVHFISLDLYESKEKWGIIRYKTPARFDEKLALSHDGWTREAPTQDEIVERFVKGVEEAHFMALASLTAECHLLLNYLPSGDVVAIQLPTSSYHEWRKKYYTREF